MGRRHIRSCTLLALALAAGCATPPRTPEPEPEPTVLPADSESTVRPTPTPEPPQDLSRDFRDAADRMNFWLSLALPPADRSEGPIVLRKHGYAISQLDYSNALSVFLEGRSRTPELEQEFRRELSDELLLLRWMETKRQIDSPRYRVEVRRQVRELVAMIALESQIAATPIPEEAIRALYQERIEQFQSSEMVQIRMILVPDENSAEDILSRLDSGESFRAIALAESVHESRGRGGDIEPFVRGSYIGELEDLAFTIPVGQIGTVRTNVGIFIIQKVASIPAVTIPYEEARAELLEELEERRLRQGREEFLGRISQELGP